MTINDATRDFIDDLQMAIEELAENDSIKLWRECEYVEEPIAKQFDELTLSVWNRIQQATYYKALDTFVEALKITLLGSEEEEDESESD